MAKRGRPVGSVKKKTITVSLDPGLYERVRKRAKAEGRSISGYLRRVLDTGLAKTSENEREDAL